MRFVLFLLLMSLTTPSSARAQPDSSIARVLEKDLATFASWFPGRYDNELQTFFDPDLGTPETERRQRRHVVVRAVAAPKFGKQVFLVAGHPHAEEGDTLLISVGADVAERSLRLEAFRVVKPLPAEAEARDRLVAQLSDRDVAPAPDASAMIRLYANQFEGGARAEGDPPRFRLTPDEWRVAAAGPGEPYRLRKARAFECWTAILRGARHGDSGEGLDDWRFQRGGWIHDQGGELVLTSEETEPREIRLRLRRVEWPSGPNRPSLTLYVHEGDNRRAVSYAWAEDDAERIGINLRWVQASCTHAPDRTFD